jgi:hypothetical protein
LSKRVGSPRSRRQLITNLAQVNKKNQLGMGNFGGTMQYPLAGIGPTIGSLPG